MAAKEEFTFSKEPNLEKIRQIHDQFSRERDWGQYHTPRNLTLALVGEVGELAEIFQWKGEVAEGLPGWPDKERKALEEEMSDILIYLVRLADKCHVDLPSAVLKKIELNRKKYPIEKALGSSKKYTEFIQNDLKMINGDSPYSPLASLEKQVAEMQAEDLREKHRLHQYTRGQKQSDNESKSGQEECAEKLQSLDIKSTDNSETNT